MYFSGFYSYYPGYYYDYQGFYSVDNSRCGCNYYNGYSRSGYGCGCNCGCNRCCGGCCHNMGF